MTQKEEFLHSLRMFDIEMLDQVLKEDCVCFGARKSVFLKWLRDKYYYLKAEDAIEEFKLYKHKRKDVYYFYSSSSLYANKFSIIETDKGEIIELKNNIEVHTENDYVNLHKYAFYFGIDERIGFQPNIEYLVLKEECETAYNKVRKDVVFTFTKNDIKAWVDEYRYLYEAIYDKYSIIAYQDFREIYSQFEFILKTLAYAIQAKNALIEFLIDNSMIYDWYLKHRRLALVHVIRFNGYFEIIDVENYIVQDPYNSNYFFKGKEFFDIIRFNEVFYDIYFNDIL